MSDTDDHSSLTHVYASGDGSGLASQNDLSPSELEQGGMITIASFSQDYQAPTVLYDFGGNSATAFGPEQQSVDTVLKSSDAVFFYVHRHVLDGSSENGFGAGNVGRSLIAVDDEATFALQKLRIDGRQPRVHADGRDRLV